MIILIKVDDNKVLEAVNKGMISVGYPKNDILDDPKYIDEEDIVNYLIRNLDINVDDIEIEKD